MNQIDFEGFRSLLVGMGKLYDKEVDSLLLDAYWVALSNWSMTDFRSACQVLMASNMFMPRPADFNGLHKAREMTPGEAWGHALKRCLDWRKALESKDRVDRAMRAVGGPRAIAMSDVEKDLPHLEKRFKQAYEELTEVEAVREALPGMFDSKLLEDNNIVGYPRLIS